MAKAKNTAAGSGPHKLRIGKLPSKTTINLATIGQKPFNVKAAIPAVLIVCALIFAFSKFLVIDRLAAVAEAQRKVNDLQRQLDQSYAELESYGDLNELYAHYTYSGFTTEELTRTSRDKVLELIRDKVLPGYDLSSWTLHSNELTLVLGGETLQEINMLAQKLQDDPLVNYCTVSTANTNDLNRYNYDLNNYYYDDHEYVSARILVYLNPEAEVKE